MTASTLLGKAVEGQGLEGAPLYIPDPLLTERETAKWLSVGVSTLQRWRSQRHGPAFVRLSERRIGYRKSTVERWLSQVEVVPPGDDPQVNPAG
jgi:predicted DNA-binding transcriptional regulator AlpA